MSNWIEVVASIGALFVGALLLTMIGQAIDLPNGTPVSEWASIFVAGGILLAIVFIAAVLLGRTR
jgi:hypothetical protein